jgi:UDP-glucose 4-epimerase
MAALVTGGAGFIGSHLVERLSETERVICLDNFDDYYSPKTKEENTKGFPENVKVIRADLLDKKKLSQILDEEGIETVYHLGAQAGVRASVENPIKTNQANITGTLNLLESMRQTGVKQMVFASSSSIYGEIEYLPFDEKHPKKPLSPYGVTKLACEKYLNAYRQLYGLEYAALRYFTVYGPRIRPDLAIHKFARSALAQGKLTIYGDGSKTRDFTHVQDAVNATIKAKRGVGAYNIGGGIRLSVRELAEKIIEYAGSGTIEYVQDQKGDVLHTESDTRKARRELGWKPEKKFVEGLRETIDWIRKTQGY